MSLSLHGLRVCRAQRLEPEEINKEYVDLVDSLSTDLFDDVDSTLSAASPFQRNRNRQPSTGPITGQVGSLGIELDDPTSA
jgi:hypothetical protein